MHSAHAHLINRYLIREILLTTLAVMALLLLIVVSNRLARYLAEAAAGSIGSDMIFSLLGLKLVGMITLLMPPALFVAVILALGRLYKDSEMVALSACGIGGVALYRPLLLFAVPVVVVLTWLALVAAPASAAKGYILKERAQAQAEMQSVIAGRFKETRDGQRIFFVERIADDKERVENIFTQIADKGIPKLQTAREALRQRDPETGAQYLIMRDGHLYEGVPGRGDYRIIHFEEQVLRLPSDDSLPVITKHDATPTRALLASDAPRDIAEWQSRMSVPISALLLMLMALPLAHATPRTGRYGRLGFAVLIYIVYANLQNVAQAWLKSARIPAELGMWWVHGLALLLLLILMVRRYGWPRRGDA